MPDTSAADRSTPVAPVGTPPTAEGAEPLPDVKWTPLGSKDSYLLGMTIWPVLEGVRFDLFRGDLGPDQMYVCSNPTVAGARALRDNLDRFLTACDQPEEGASHAGAPSATRPEAGQSHPTPGEKT